jgi:hypothetical protein
MAMAKPGWGYTNMRDALRTGLKIEIGRKTQFQTQPFSSPWGYTASMKRVAGLLLTCLLAACSSSEGGNDNPAKPDSATGADALDSSTTETGTTVFSCPSTIPGVNSACTREGAICDYSFTLNCPVGCSGGDFHSYQCSKGLWVDYRHSAGAPQCRCQPLDFPKGMQGIWRFSETGIPAQYVWIRFSALGDTLSDAGTPGHGTIEILAGPDLPTASIPWWSCNGQGRWFITQTPQAFEVRPSTTCASATKSEIYTVTSRQSTIPASLSHCLLLITMESTSGSKMEACKYSDTQCDAAMATCQTQ